MSQCSVILGRYPQDHGAEKEPIEWMILKEEGHRCLCISKYLLDCKPYHSRPEKVIWQDCALRDWLNHGFLMTAFSAEERKKILLSNVANPAQNTQDYIFLLSYDEAEEYFDDENYEGRKALTTAYARKQGAWFLDEECDGKNNGCWWLRYYGRGYMRKEGAYDLISCVNFDGYIERGAEDVSGTCGVRPVFWMKTV